MTGIGIYYPHGRKTQLVCLVPDVIMRPIIAGLRQGRDKLRDWAMELILQPTASNYP